MEEKKTPQEIKLEKILKEYELAVNDFQENLLSMETRFIIRVRRLYDKVREVEADEPN